MKNLNIIDQLYTAKTLLAQFAETIENSLEGDHPDAEEVRQWLVDADNSQGIAALRNARLAVQDSTDQAGCSEELVVVDKVALDRLLNLLFDTADEPNEGRLETIDGEPITGTWEHLPGIAVVDNATRNDDGSIEPTYAGETEVCWNGQKSVFDNGQRLFVTETGKLVPESQVRIVEDD